MSACNLIGFRGSVPFNFENYVYFTYRYNRVAIDWLDIRGCYNIIII